MFFLMEASNVLCEVINESLYKSRFILMFRGLILKFFRVHDDRFAYISAIQEKQKPNTKR